MKTEYEKMIAGEPYRPQDQELRQLAAKSREYQYTFNLLSKNGLVLLVRISQFIQFLFVTMVLISI